jgi:hypothetical protein
MKFNLIPKFSGMTEGIHHGNLKSYLSQAIDQTSLLKALTKQLGKVTHDVDPEQGYASTLLNLSKRMQMSERLLAKEVGIKIPGAVKSTDTEGNDRVESAGISCVNIDMILSRPRERLRDFL